MFALFRIRRRDCPATFAGYVGKSTPRTAPPIAFITKFKAPMPAFGFFGRKTGYIVADRGGRVAETVVSPLSNRIDAIFQAVIIRSWEGHGPS
jgi:1-acyl-sn-glycerol-3-phosphate acyltransferase